MMTATCSSQNDPSIDGMMIFHFISRWFLPISWLPSVTSTAHPWKSLKINDWKMIFPVGAGLFSEAMSGRVTMLPSQLRWASFSGRCPFYACGKLDVFLLRKSLVSILTCGISKYLIFNLEVRQITGGSREFLWFQKWCHWDHVPSGKDCFVGKWYASCIQSLDAIPNAHPWPEPSTNKMASYSPNTSQQFSQTCQAIHNQPPSPSLFLFESGVARVVAR